MSEESMIKSAENRNIVFNPKEIKECSFGDEDYDTIGEVFDYILREGGESESFKWELIECRGSYTNKYKYQDEDTESLTIEENDDYWKIFAECSNNFSGDTAYEDTRDAAWNKLIEKYPRLINYKGYKY